MESSTIHIINKGIEEFVDKLYRYKMSNTVATIFEKSIPVDSRGGEIIDKDLYTDIVSSSAQDLISDGIAFNKLTASSIAAEEMLPNCFIQSLGCIVAKYVGIEANTRKNYIMRVASGEDFDELNDMALEALIKKHTVDKMGFSNEHLQEKYNEEFDLLMSSEGDNVIESVKQEVVDSIEKSEDIKEDINDVVEAVQEVKDEHESSEPSAVGGDAGGGAAGGGGGDAGGGDSGGDDDGDGGDDDGEEGGDDDMGMDEGEGDEGGEEGDEDEGSESAGPMASHSNRNNYGGDTGFAVGSSQESLEIDDPVMEMLFGKESYDGSVVHDPNEFKFKTDSTTADLEGDTSIIDPVKGTSSVESDDNEEVESNEEEDTKSEEATGLVNMSVANEIISGKDAKFNIISKKYLPLSLEKFSRAPILSEESLSNILLKSQDISNIYNDLRDRAGLIGSYVSREKDLKGSESTYIEDELESKVNTYIKALENAHNIAINKAASLGSAGMNSNTIVNKTPTNMIICKNILNRVNGLLPKNGKLKNIYRGDEEYVSIEKKIDSYFNIKLQRKKHMEYNYMVGEESLEADDEMMKEYLENSPDNLEKRELFTAFQAIDGMFAFKNITNAIEPDELLQDYRSAFRTVNEKDNGDVILTADEVFNRAMANVASKKGSEELSDRVKDMIHYAFEGYDIGTKYATDIDKIYLKLVANSRYNLKSGESMGTDDYNRLLTEAKLIYTIHTAGKVMGFKEEKYTQEFDKFINS